MPSWHLEINPLKTDQDLRLPSVVFRLLRLLLQFGLLATPASIQAMAVVLLPAAATPLPEEWPTVPTVPATQLPPQQPMPVLLPRVGRPDLVPAQVEVGDLVPPGQVSLVTEQSGEDWLHPLPHETIEQSPWGWRWSEARGVWRMHTGVDLIVPSGTPVLAARSGRVVLAEWVSGYGLTVLISHTDGWQTLYAHLQSMDVRAGSPIARGERLGRVGDTGSATTPHLHLELRREGERGVHAVNPAALLKAPRPSRTQVLAAELGS